MKPFLLIMLGTVAVIGVLWAVGLTHEGGTSTRDAYYPARSEKQTESNLMLLRELARREEAVANR